MFHTALYSVMSKNIPQAAVRAAQAKFLQQ